MTSLTHIAGQLRHPSIAAESINRVPASAGVMTRDVHAGDVGFFNFIC